MTNTITTDLAHFGSRERRLLIALLQAWQDHGLPNGFDDNNVRPTLNRNSGYVFLTNDDYQVAMLNLGNFELFHTLPDTGDEGFLCDLLANNEPDDLSCDDMRYLFDAIETAQPSYLPDAWSGKDEADADADTDA